MNAGRRALLVASLLVASITTPSIGKDTATHLFGPPPSWEAYRAIAEPALQAQLIDPESARVTWSGGYYKGSFKPFLSSRIEGYVGCGHINGRNRMGGYAGATAFVVVIDYDRVLYAAIADPHLDGVSIQCSDAMNRGLIPPLPVAAVTASTVGAQTEATGHTRAGLTLRAMPEGAYVSAVEPGSSAATAGLKPGMVVTAINGIPLAGMGDAMLKVAAAAEPASDLTIVGGTTVKLGATK